MTMLITKLVYGYTVIMVHHHTLLIQINYVLELNSPLLSRMLYFDEQLYLILLPSWFIWDSTGNHFSQNMIHMKIPSYRSCYTGTLSIDYKTLALVLIMLLN